VLKAMRAWSFREDLTCQGCLALMVGALLHPKRHYSVHAPLAAPFDPCVQGSDTALLLAGAAAGRRHVQIGARAYWMACMPRLALGLLGGVMHGILPI